MSEFLHLHQSLYSDFLKMGQFIPDESLFSGLQDKIIVITGRSKLWYQHGADILSSPGGATGIGAATVKMLAKHGAKVVIGDINTSVAEELASQLPGVSSRHCDVTKYDDIYKLYRAAHKQHGVIHHAISCAGILERGNWFDPNLTIETVKEPGDAKVLDINLIGTLNVSRIAVPFLRDGLKKGDNRSLTLLSSVNAFRESPGLYMYQVRCFEVRLVHFNNCLQTSKHGVHGILRSTRKILFERDGIRVNAVCPGVTDTPMVAPVIGAFKDNNLYWQTPDSVARFIVALEATPNMNGKAIYIEGGDGWEFEDSFYAMQPQWLGEEATRRMRVNAEAVNRVGNLEICVGSILRSIPRAPSYRRSRTIS